jgi:nucleolar pre-ribosomal-associated protein 2
MILKWLLDKFSSSSEARVNSQAWVLFSDCLRLLPRRRIATVLGANDIVEIIHRTCVESNVTSETHSEIARSLNLLLHLAEKEDGSAVQSLLSIGDDLVAEICGCWFQHVYNRFGADDGIHSIMNQDLLNPGLRLWELRQRSQYGDALFTSRCLVPVLLLLEALHHQAPTRTPKRKRNGTSLLSASEIIRVLEELVARHSIAQFRAAFALRPHDLAGVVADYEPQQAQLRDLFQPLCELPPSVIARQMVKVMPLLLDIAIRSSKTTSPKDRLRERPWVEAVFTALHGCVIRVQESASDTALADMLQVLYTRNFALSDHIIASLVRDSSISSPSMSSFAEWHLVAQICKVHPMALTEPNVASFVFGRISHECVNSHSTRTKQDTRPRDTNVVRNAIIVPILEAFGQSRRMKVFVEIWSQQLGDTLEAENGIVWSEVGRDFARVSISSMTHEQIIEAVEHHSLEITRRISTASGAKNTSRELYISFVLLSAFIQSARSEIAVMKIYQSLEALRVALQNPTEPDIINSAPELRSEYMHLLTVVFRAWMPSWIAQQTDKKSVDDVAAQLSSSKALGIALAGLEGGDKPQISAKRTEVASSTFLATICESFMPYAQLTSTELLLRKVFKSLNFSSTSKAVLPEHIDVLRSLVSSAPENFVQSYLDQIPSACDENSRKSAVAYIASVVVALSGRLVDSTVDSPINILVQELCNRLASCDNPSTELCWLSVLDAVPLSMVTDQERKRVVDTITDLAPPRSIQGHLTSVEGRLATLIKWLEGRASDARIITDAACVWELTQISNASDGQSQMSQVTIYDLFERLARIVFDQCAKTQRSEHVQQIFASHSERLKAHMLNSDGASETRSLRQHCSQAVAKIALQVIEQEIDDKTKQKPTHRVPKLLSNYLECIAAAARLSSDSIGEHPVGARGTIKAFVAMDALVAVPESILGILPDRGGAHKRQVVIDAVSLLEQACDNSAQTSDQVDDNPAAASWQRTIARAYAVVCRHAANEPQDFSALTTEVLQQSCSADSHAAVLTSFQDVLKGRPPAWRKSMLDHQLRHKNQMSGVALLLQRAIVRTLAKEDMDEDFLNAGINNLLRQTVAAAKGSEGVRSAKAAMESLALFLKEKPFMMNQFGIEEILTALHRVVDTPKLLVVLYLNVTHLLNILLTHYRARLQGRFHLINAIFQGLFSGVFQSADRNSARKPLAVRQARTLARLLSLYCDPPHLRHRNKSSDLIDEARKEKGRVGQFLPSVLHHYCSQVLTGADGPEVREALNPGVWAMVEAIEGANPEGIKVLSAALNNSERAVLRAMYDDWKRFGKWEGL